LRASKGRELLGLSCFCAALALASMDPQAWGQQILRPAIPVQSKDVRFIKAAHAALELLRQRAPDDFEFARTHVGLIREVARWEDVGMAVTGSPPTASFLRQDVTRSVTWAASIIVHEACHRFQYVRAAERLGGRFPPNYEFSGRIAELECLKRQGDALERVGAPDAEIAYVRKQDGRHYRKDQFGRYYKSPPGGGVWWDPSGHDPREPRRQE
jgi:hypothetical protein